MATKATKAKPKKRAPKSVPLDDPRWMLAADVHKLLTQRTGNKSLAALDLTEALGELRCMRRSARSGIRELVPPSLWVSHQFESWDRGLLVIPRPPTTLPKNQIVMLKRLPIRGWIFYVWQPDIAKLWPWLQAVQHTEPVDRTDEHRGRKPALTSAQTFTLQIEYQRYKAEHGLSFKMEDANAHLRRIAKAKWGIIVQHPDTIRDHVMKPVDDPDAVEK